MNHNKNNSTSKDRGQSELTVASMKQSEQGRLMINLVRKIQLKFYPILAKVTFQQPRPDLVSLLEKMKENADNMPDRLKVYLQKEKLWNPDLAALTEKGEEVLISGDYEAKERGLYHIWYTDDDPLFGTAPFFIQRDTALFEPKNTKVWKKGPDAARSIFKVDKPVNVEVLSEGMHEKSYNKGSRDKIKTVLLSRIEPEVICSSSLSSALELSWSILGSTLDNELTDSKFIFNGQLDVFDFHQNKSVLKPEEMDISLDGFDEDLSNVMNCIALEFNGEWDDSTQRLAAPLNKIKAYLNAVANFKISSKSFEHFNTVYGLFDNVIVKQIPLKPKDQNDAKKWHQYWLEAFYNKAYHSSKNAREQQANWLDNLALTNFLLPLKEGAHLLESVTRELHPQAYWHIAAMADLTPSKSKKSKFPLSLVNGDALNIDDLINKLTGGIPVSLMIYADRYVHTSRQSRNLRAVAACVKEAKGILLTLGIQHGNEAVLPPKWERKTQLKQPDNHGRYWIFISGGGVICWECSSGLDFMKENTVEGTPTFTPREEDELPRFLQSVIKETQSEAAA